MIQSRGTLALGAVGSNTMHALYVKGPSAGIMGGADDAMNIIVAIAALLGEGAR